MWSLSFKLCFFVCIGLASGYEKKSVYQYLVDNGYTMFAKYIRDAGLQTKLSGNGPFTIFAPTDAALKSLDADTLNDLSHSKLQVKRLVEYHILNGYQLIIQLQGASSLKTLEGQNIAVTTENKVVVLNNASRVTSLADIVCINGIIQPITVALKPPMFKLNNIASVLLLQDFRFQIFFDYLLMANLTQLLEGGEYTVLAPVDAAWAQYVEQILHPRNVSQDLAIHVFMEMMKYHLIPGARTSDMFHDGDRIFTLHGYPVNVTTHYGPSGNGVRIERANVLEADIQASNGVIHAVDHVLFPHDLFLELIRIYRQTHPTSASRA